jgi:hypothetical protein
MAMTYHCAGLHLSGGCTPGHGAAQVCDKRGLPGRVAKALGSNVDQVGLGRGPHAYIIGTQVKDVATIQGGQGGGQARLLVHS